jgi:hypothetical protein
MSEHELQVGGRLLAEQVGHPVENQHHRAGLLGERGREADQELSLHEETVRRSADIHRIREK